jgi:hypothetical protein
MLNFKQMVGIRFVAKLTVANGALQIELGFWERLGSLSRNSEIKLLEIEQVEAVEDVKMRIFGNRMLGTGLPKVVVLGHFRNDKKKMMVYWVRGQQAVILDLKSGPYQRMIIGCSDAKALTKELELGV